MTALLRDYDGGYPKNLEELLPLGMTDALEQAIGEFKQWLRQQLFLTRDLLPHNIIAVADKPARYRLVVVDGIGNSEFIPLSHWFTFCARAKIERKIRKFDYRTRIPPSRTIGAEQPTEANRKRSPCRSLSVSKRGYAGCAVARHR